MNLKKLVSAPYKRANRLFHPADSIIVGNFVGSNALAAVGSSGSPIFLLIGFSQGIAVGAGVVVSQFLGAKDREGAHTAVHTSLALSAILGAILTVCGIAVSRALLTAMNTPAEVLEDAVLYMRLYFGGVLFSVVYNMAAGILNAAGNSKRSLLYLGVASITNIVLDLVLIAGCKMGVAGAAIATVLSQAVSAVWILRFLTGRKTILRLKARNMLLQGKIILPCLALGISNFVMVSTESILSVSFTSSLSRYGGDVAVGAMTVLTSVNQLITMPLQGICQGGQPLISYNYGAKKLERVKEAFFCQFLVCVGYTTVFWLLVMAFPKVFAGIFTSDGALVDYTAWAIRIFLAGTFSVGFQVSCQLAFMALGQAKISLIMACLRKLILLIPLIFILPNFFADKAFAVFLAEPVSDILAAAVTTITFFTFFRKLLKAGKQ